MNYRHSFHAGNHTEVFKHSVLCLLVLELQKKPKPIRVLDTHAGAGMYDLCSPESQRTGEAHDGIGVIFEKNVPAASDYLKILHRLNPDFLRYYPGSPAIVQALLRSDDRVIACELHNDDAELLRANFKDDRRISVQHRDGYEAIGAFVPPPTRRGLVFIDSPFEQADEFERLARALNSGIKKWPTGIFLAWYPLKERSGVKRLRAVYDHDNPSTLCCEFLRQRLDGTALAGSGLILCNPPWHFEIKLRDLCRQLLIAFDATTGNYTLDWWARGNA